MPNHAPLSNDFFDTFDDIQRKQQWYKEYLQEQGTQALAFVGKYQFSAKLPAGQIAADILNILGLTELKRKQCRDYKAFYNLFSEKVEGIGILVFKNSIVKNNTHRSLSVDEFRGFAIADALVPVIFINGKDSEAAWIFTLAHELAHIWLGESGVSDITEKQSNGYSLEIYCNRIAAELLTPQAEFLVAWEQNPYQFEVLSKIFKVSKLVIARRALDLGKIDWPQYQEISEASKQTKSSNRADPYLTYPIRNSKRLTRIIVSNALNGSIMLRDAAKLLNIKPDTIMQLSKELGLR